MTSVGPVRNMDNVSHGESKSSRPPDQFGLRRLLELPVLFVVFFWLGDAIGLGPSAALAAITVSMVGYFVSGTASLYPCVLFIVLIGASVCGAIHGERHDGRTPNSPQPAERVVA